VTESDVHYSGLAYSQPRQPLQGHNTLLQFPLLQQQVFKS